MVPHPEPVEPRVLGGDGSRPHVGIARTHRDEQDIGLHGPPLGTDRGLSSDGARCPYRGSVIGILATTRVVARGRGRRAARRPFVVLAACLALLALLGTSPDADILAHLFGLLVGGVLGLATGFAPPSARRPSVQWMLALAALGALVASWLCASS